MSNAKTELEKAKKLLNNSESTCVIYKSGLKYTSDKKGVAPLVEVFNQGIDISGASAADKIVGKAAALLFVLGKVKAVYSPVMSEDALILLSVNGIKVEFDKLVPMIMNREGTDQCPMEKAVMNIDEPIKALEAIKDMILILQSGKKESVQ